MRTRLVNYLKDNRDQIIENWLTETDLPLPEALSKLPGCKGTVPLAFLEGNFEQVLNRISEQPCNCGALVGTLHLDDFLEVTCACTNRKLGGRVCVELHESGLRAFTSVLNDNWDVHEEFNHLDREYCASLINEALSKTFASEIGRCQHKHERSDCPFVAHQLEAQF